jgi:hypothetical protein
MLHIVDYIFENLKGSSFKIVGSCAFWFIYTCTYINTFTCRSNEKIFDCI